MKTFLVISSFAILSLTSVSAQEVYELTGSFEDTKSIEHHNVVAKHDGFTHGTFDDSAEKRMPASAHKESAESVHVNEITGTFE